MIDAIRYFFQRLWRGILRPLAFFGKEVTQIRRQPQLILALIVAPFLVLLLFGIGYSGQTPALDTVLVVPESSGLSTNFADYQDDFVYPLVLKDVVTDRNKAIDELQDRKIDVVVALPPDAFETITSGKQAEIDLFYNELVPIQRNWIRFYSRVQTAEINQRVLREVMQQSLNGSASNFEDLNGYPADLQSGLNDVTTDVQNGQQAEAAQRLKDLQTRTRETEDSATQYRRFLLATALSVGATGVPKSPPIQNLEAATQRLNEIETGLNNINVKLQNDQAGAQDIQGDLDFVNQNRQEYADIASTLPAVPVDTLVEPFAADETNLAPTSPDFVDFYSPAVLALLIQHIAITLTALSLVRERLRGTVELFQISPLSGREILSGKYIAYLIQGGILTAILTLTMIYGLGVPMLGSIFYFVLLLGLVLAASLGIGFLISASVRSDSQAVQMSMIILLASVFFSGFFLPLDNLLPGVQVISYALPVTYGIRGLQEIMLRGAMPPGWVMAALGAMAVAFIGLAGIVLNYRLRRR